MHIWLGGTGGGLGFYLRKAWLIGFEFVSEFNF